MISSISVTPLSFFKAKADANIIFPWPDDARHVVISENFIAETHRSIIKTKGRLPYVGDLFSAIWDYNQRVSVDLAVDYIGTYSGNLAPCSCEDAICYDWYDNKIEAFFREINFVSMMSEMDEYIPFVLNKYGYSYLIEKEDQETIIVNDCQNVLMEHFAVNDIAGYSYAYLVKQKKAVKLLE